MAGAGGHGGGTGGGRGGAGLLAAVLVVSLAAESARAPEVHLDLAPLYGAGLLFEQGRLAEAYEVDGSDQRFAGSALTDAARARGYPVRRVLRFLHPPALAAAASILAPLDFPEAALVFRGLSLLALAVAAALLARAAKGGPTHAAFIVLALLLAHPVRTTLDLGQTNLMVLALVALATAVRSEPAAGIALGLASVLKTYVLGAPVVLVVSGRFRAAAAAAVVFGAAHGIAFAADPEGTAAYAGMLRELSGWQFLWPDQQSAAAQVARVESGFDASDLSGWTDRAVPAGAAGAAGAAWAVAVLGSAVLLAIRRKPDLPSATALGVAAGVLASPVLHTHYPVVLAVPAAWLAGRGRHLPAALLIAGGIALAALPLRRGEADFLLHYIPGRLTAWFFVTRALLAAALVFAGTAWAIARGQGKPAASPGA